MGRAVLPDAVHGAQRYLSVYADLRYDVRLRGSSLDRRLHQVRWARHQASRSATSSSRRRIAALSCTTSLSPDSTRRRRKRLAIYLWTSSAKLLRFAFFLLRGRNACCRTSRVLTPSYVLRTPSNPSSSSKLDGKVFGCCARCVHRSRNLVRVWLGRHLGCQQHTLPPRDHRRGDSTSRSFSEAVP